MSRIVQYAHRASAFFAALTFFACAHSVTAQSSSVPAAANLVVSHGDGRVGTYVSPEWGFSTNSYWIEGPTALILIDAQFLPSAADEMVSFAEKLTGKKAALAIVLHPNPDKFNGTATLQKRGIRVVTSEQVLKLIPSVDEDRRKAFYSRYQPDYPREVPRPESFGTGTRDIEAAGTKITLHVLGPGCSGAHVVAEYQGHVFTGDLVANYNHSWLELGQVPEWLQRLKEISALHPKFVHPGRGPSGGPELLTREADYLRDVTRRVARLRPWSSSWKKSSEDAKDTALDRVASELRRAYPGYGFDVFLDIGLPAVWERLAREPKLAPEIALSEAGSAKQ